MIRRTLHRLREFLWPFGDELQAGPDPAFTERMQAARRYGVVQKQESRRQIQRQQVNRLEEAYLYHPEVRDE